MQWGTEQLTKIMFTESSEAVFGAELTEEALRKLIDERLHIAGEAPYTCVLSSEEMAQIPYASPSGRETFKVFVSPKTGTRYPSYAIPWQLVS